MDLPGLSAPPGAMRNDPADPAVATTIDHDDGDGVAADRGVLPPPADRAQLGDFVLGEIVGRGGFGTVYRAEQRGLGRPAVVKVIHRVLTSQAARRFVLEAQLAARFDHPYAAHVYAFGVEADGVMWIAMELVRGTPLGELVADAGPIALDRFVSFLDRLCEVVQSAHDQNIIHRDIKPSNVMVIARAGRLLPKLLDFGIAKFTHADADDAIEVGRSASRDHTLTQDGQLLGSPAYMAPEQWRDAAGAGPAADQYALALLAYEAITGAPAFAGATIEAFANQHFHAALPALPPHIPLALRDVLARGTAKSPAARYPSVTAFAEAFRAAAGAQRADIGEAVATLPVAVATRWIADAPRPIADAIAALVASHSIASAAERISAVACIVARWLGVTALACRSQLGRIVDPDSREHELVLELRRRLLLETEWIDLAVALTQHVRTPELWPVPELASFAALPGAAGDLQRLAADRAPADPNLLEARTIALATILDRLEWLCDYRVVYDIGERLVSFTGRRTEGLDPEAVPAGGDVVLLDGDGARIARLSPLVKIRPPLPGAPDELFLFVGAAHGEGTARLVSYPHAFQCDEPAIWDALARHVVDIAPATDGRLLTDRPPYPGLAAYTRSDQASFVGREREVEELCNRLRTHSLVTVVGPSGMGKTSFLAAGLVPALAPGWHPLIVRPGHAPLEALAAVVDRLDGLPYRDGPAVPPGHAAELASRIAALAERRAITLVVIVDQAEELFTMCVDAAARAAIAEILYRASRSPRVRVVLAMRDDFLCRADDLPVWRGHLGHCVQVLGTPSRDDLERILTVPARRRGFDFDDPRLPREIVDEVVGRPGALPLLAFAAAELWEHRDRHFRQLTRATYRAIGGVAGALVQHADGIVDRMPASDRRLVRLAFRRLLAVDGTRIAIARAELESALDAAPAASVIDRLLAARLIVSRDDEPGDRLEIIHETLATTWPRLAAWRREDAAGAKLQEQLSVAARHWDEHGRPIDRLWRGDALADLVRWRSAPDHAGTPLEEAFVHASLDAARRRRRRTFGIVTAAFVVLVAGMVGLVSANRIIGDQRSTAIERLAASFEERGRIAVGAGDDARALLYLAEASRLGARGPGLDVLASHAAGAVDGGLQIIGHAHAGILSFDRSPSAMLGLAADFSLWRWDHGARHHISDGVYCAAQIDDLSLFVSLEGELVAIDGTGHRSWRVTGAVTNPRMRCAIAGSRAAALVMSIGDTVKLWDADSGASRGQLEDDKPISSAALDPTGMTIATGSVAGDVRIWDAATTKRITTCASHHGSVRALRFTRGAQRVVSAGSDGEVHVCDTATGRTLHVLIGHTKAVTTLDVSSDGTTIISGGRDGKPRIWDASSGLLVATLEGHRGIVLGVALSPDGNRVLTVGVDGSARIWNRDGIALASLQGHGGPIFFGAWDDTGRGVVTASYDGAIRHWDVESSVNAHVIRAHVGGARDVDVSGDDRWIATAGEDRSASLWDRRSHRQVAALRHPAEVVSVAFDPGTTEILTTDATGTARIWALAGFQLRATLAGATVATFAPDGSIITAAPGEVRWWSSTGNLLASVPCPYVPDALVIDPGGRWLFVRGTTSALRVIDLRARTVVTDLAIRDSKIQGLAVDASEVAVTDGTKIRSWQLGTWMPNGLLVGHQAPISDLWFLPDGRLVSAAFDGAFVWSDGYPHAKLVDVSQVYALAMSPDGALIATTGNDGAINVWDATDYRNLLQIAGHRAPGRAIRFTRDGRALASTGDDGRLVIWRIPRRTRTAAELAEIVRCRVPLKLEGDVVLPRDLDFDDPSCRSVGR